MRWMLVASLALVACGTTQSTQMVEVANASPHGGPAPEVHETQGSGIKLRLVSIFGDIITCEVINLTAEPVLVDRDAVVLVTPTGERRSRLPGGAQTTYQVPPSGSHVVNVRYDLGGMLDEDVAQLDFSHAVLRAGQPVSIPPLFVNPKKQTTRY